jgi:hypothetical protein
MDVNLRVDQPDAVLIGVAILKANWDLLKKDYVENFVPMIAEAIRTSRHDVVSLPELSGDLFRLFGLRLPQNQVRAILPRVAKRGYIRLQNGVYFRVPARLASLDFLTLQNQVIRKHEAVVSSLCRFAKDNYSFTWAPDAAEAALHIYLQKNRLLSRTPTDSTPQLLADAALPGANFIVGKFVDEVRKAGGLEFDYLETIVKGNILATAIFLSDPHRAVERFKKTYIYLDTPLLIYALGHAGPARHAPTKELVILLNQAGAELRAFRHTIDEVNSILTACAFKIETNDLRNSYGPSIEYFLANNFSGSDIRLLAGRVEDGLEALRIKIVDKPAMDPASMIDEAKLSDLIDKYVHHDKLNPRIRDVASVSAVIRLRDGKESLSIETCGALFVTTNAALVRAAREFVFGEAQPDSIAPCVTDHYLTNVMWLKMPMQAEDLPRKKIIAACFAAARPDERLWNGYLAEIDKLEKVGNITADDYYLLRHSLQARDVLMEVTLGEEAAFSEGTIQQVLDEVKRNIVKEADQRLKAAEQEVATVQAKLIALAAQVDPEHLKRAATSEGELTQLRAQVMARVMSQRARCAAMALTFVSVIKWIVIVLLMAGVASTFPWQFPPITTSVLRYGLTLLQVAVLLVGVTNIVWGTTVVSGLRRLELYLTSRLERFVGVTDEQVAVGIGPLSL